MRVSVRIWLVAAVVLAGTSPALAQESPYVEHQTRPIKALSAEQVQDYLDGKGMGFALAAELNAYPGPKHVLEMKDELGLGGERLNEVEAIFGRMQARAKELGEQIVALERRLDAAFQERRVTSSELEEVPVCATQGRDTVKIAKNRSADRAFLVIGGSRVRA